MQPTSIRLCHKLYEPFILISVMFEMKVLVPMEPDLMGKLVDVRIISATKFSLISEPLVSQTPQRPDVPEALPKGQLSGAALPPPVQERSKAAHSVTWWPLAALSALLGLRLAWILYRRR